MATALLWCPSVCQGTDIGRYGIACRFVDPQWLGVAGLKSERKQRFGCPN